VWCTWQCYYVKMILVRFVLRAYRYKCGLEYSFYFLIIHLILLKLKKNIIVQYYVLHYFKSLHYRNSIISALTSSYQFVFVLAWWQEMVNWLPRFRLQFKIYKVTYHIVSCCWVHHLQVFQYMIIMQGWTVSWREYFLSFPIKTDLHTS